MISRAAPLTADVVAVIPTLRRSPRLDRCVQSVLDAAGDRDLRVFVIVNGGDGSKAAEVDGPVTYLQTGVNLGWAGGLAFAYERLSARLVWAVQDDMVVQSTCLERLSAALDADAGLGAARPLILDVKGRVARRSGGGYLRPDGGQVRGWPMRARRLPVEVPDDLTFVAGSGMLIRSAAWREVGGWDPAYYPVGFADVDFNRRLTSAGWRVALVTDAHAAHPGSGSTPTHLRFLLGFHNRRRYEAKWGEGTATPTQPEGPRIHPDLTREQLAELLALSNAALFDLDNWLATQHVARPVSQRVRGLYWTARAFVNPRL